MRWLGGCLLVLLCACEREPAIVVRFDPVDQGSTVAPQTAKRDLAVAAPATDAAAVAPDLATAAKDKDKDKPKANVCTTDADCVLVEDGCCSCANGGKLKAVPKRDEPKLAAARKNACADVMCTMRVSTDPSCGQRPSCQAGACVSRAARPDEVRKLVPPKNDVQ